MKVSTKSYEVEVKVLGCEGTVKVKVQAFDEVSARMKALAVVANNSQTKSIKEI